MLLKKPVTRRTFIAGVLSSSLLLLPGCGFFKGNNDESFIKRLVEVFANKASASNIGNEYLKAVPEERKRENLISGIFSTFNGGLSGITAPDKLRKELRTYIKNDFKNGNVIELKGWLFSVTEARLCALVTQNFGFFERVLTYL